MIINLANNVVQSLNEGAYGLQFTAAKTLFPFFELKDLTDLRVTVVPKSVNITGSSRSTSEYDYQIDIAIQKALSSPDDEQISDLAKLALAIARNFRGKIYQDLNAICCKQSIDPLYSVEHIQPPSVFTSVVTLNFKVIE